MDIGHLIPYSPEMTLLSLRFQCPGMFGSFPDVPLDVRLPESYSSKHLIVPRCREKSLRFSSLFFLYFPNIFRFVIQLLCCWCISGQNGPNSVFLDSRSLLLSSSWQPYTQNNISEDSAKFSLRRVIKGLN